MRKSSLMVVSFLVMVLVSTFCFGYSGGTGTESNPYQIANKADLLSLGANTNDYNKCFKMTADIDLASSNFTTAIISPMWYDWTTETHFGTEFTGTFDGGGHVISNLMITSGSFSVGLFGELGNGGTVCNLGVSGVVSSTIGINTGGVVGKNNYGVISNCYSTVNVLSTFESVGGLCGFNDENGTIIFCYATGDVTSTGGGAYKVGGLCGYNSGTIISCYATGDASGQNFVGGLCGRNDENGTIISCYATGSVASIGDYVGGFCGLDSSISGYISYCFWDIETSGMTNSAGGTGKSTAEMQTQSTFTDVGWDFVNTWVMDGYPKLQWQDLPLYVLTVNNGTGGGSYFEGPNVNISANIPEKRYVFVNWDVSPEIYTTNVENLTASDTTFTMPAEDVELTAVYKYIYGGGDGTESSPYLIDSKPDLLELAKNTNNYDNSFKMIADIDLAGESFTNAVIAIDDSVPFRGSFDGGGHVVSNLVITSSSNMVGLFGALGQAGNIHNLGVYGDISAVTYIGGIVGYNYYGVISNCYSKVSVIGYSYVGGLCGKNIYGRIVNSYSKGSIFGSYNYVGGLCADNGGTIANSYSTCSVECENNYAGGLCGDNAGLIEFCYSTGSVAGDGLFFGGLIGMNEIATGSINASFWDIDTSGMTTSFGGMGRTTSDMQLKPTFTYFYWDFVNTWVMDGYPNLKESYTSQELYELWGKNYNVPTNELGYGDCPSNDGIQNLLKYAIGLNPMQSCSVADVMEPLVETNDFSIIYNKSKGAVDVELFPSWTDSLITTNWSANGFEFERLSATSSTETWKATLPMTNDCGYIRLNAKTSD